MKRALLLLAALVCLAPLAPAQDAPLEAPQDLAPSGDGVPVGVGAADGGGADHRDDRGYPEDASGLLLLRPGRAGYEVDLPGDPDPFLLYAQFASRQRDAVLLARSGTLKDTLPSGEAVTIPYGHGALRTATTYVSVVEGQLVPHVSDSRKEYEYFPLADWYLGASIGFEGLAAGVQYVRTEKWVAYGSIGLNLLGAAGLGLYAPYGWYAVPVHLGGGVRFPGLLDELIGDNHWTVGGDLMLGLGDRDLDPATPSAVWMPGVFFELETSRPARRAAPGAVPSAALRAPSAAPGYRQDARPWNYGLEAMFLRLGAYLDLQNARRSTPLKLNLTFGWRTALAGPRIPDHPFKETRVIYIHDDYRRDIERQRERRAERLRGGGQGAP